MISAEDLPPKVASRDGRQDRRSTLSDLAREIVTDPLLSLGVANMLITQEVYRQCNGRSEAACKALGISPNTLNKYRRSMDEVSEALIAAGFDEERAARSLPDFGSASFLRRRLRAFLFGLSESALVRYQEQKGYSRQWLDYMKWVQSLPSEDAAAPGNGREPGA